MDDYGERGRRTSVLGRVDWSCWLAVAGLLFVTVISFVVQFPAMGILAVIIAILLVVFDSWVNRPKGRRAQARERATGWSEVRRVDSRPQPDQRRRPPARQPQRPAPDFRRQQPRTPQQGRPQAPRPNAGQPTRATQGQPPRQNGANPGQPQRPPMGQPAQPTRVNQGQPQRPPFRPAPPQPARGREPDYRART
jgi:hypothetical protein